MSKTLGELPENSTNTTDSPRRLTELGLLVLAWIVTASLLILASYGAQGHMPGNIWLFVGAIAALSLAMHVAIRKWAPHSSQILLPIATLLNGIGYVEIARWNPAAAQNQAIFFAGSVVVVVAILKFVRSVRDLDRYRYLTLLAAIFLLVLPLTPHFGEDIGGARLWVHVGSLTAEPVEFAKILLVFFFASYFSSNREVLSTATRRLGPFRIVSPKALLPILFAWLFCLGVLGAENNLGFAILIFMLFLCMLWVTTGLKTYVVGGLGGLIGSGYVAGNFFRQIHQRISVWLDPWSSANFHASNQIAYGWFSLAAGGITGTGLGLGRSGNIGEITSDMITAALGEELGFIGIVVILCLYAAFVGESFRIAQRTSSDFVRLAATGLTVLMGLQPFFIMAGVMRLIPFTGMALPFMSAGGSSLVANYAIVALLLRMSDENATARQGGAVISLNA